MVYGSGAGHHGAGAGDGEADDRRGRDERKEEHVSVLNTQHDPRVHLSPCPSVIQQKKYLYRSKGNGLR